MAHVWEAIRKNYVLLACDLDMKIIASLYQMEVITDEDYEVLQNIDDQNTARRTLLRILYRVSYDKHQLFVVALEKSGQKHLREAIRKSLKSGVTSMLLC